MRNLVTMLLTTFMALFLSFEANAGFQAFQGTQNLGLYTTIKCSTGVTCTKSGEKLNVVAQLSGGLAISSGMVNFDTWMPGNLTSGTSVTAVSGTTYLTQMFIPMNATLTGLKILNAATVGGANNYLLTMYNAQGTRLYNTALSGTTSTNASSFQAIPFTVSGAVTGPGVYWVGLTVSGATDTFRAVPAVGEGSGKAGSVTGQTFISGGVISGAMPTGFTADKGPIIFTY